MSWRYATFVLLFLSAAHSAPNAQLPGSVAPTAADELSIAVNIPAFRLDAFKGQTLARTLLVAVGSPRYPTPRGDFVLKEITWNPWWYPPPQPWARHEKITRPGPSNPMGKVKLHLGRGIYLHGTPAASSIGSAASHGCVRLRGDDAVALAKLVQKASGVEIDDASIETLLQSWSPTRTVHLPKTVNVRLSYELAEVRNDSLLLHPDVYHLRQGTAEAAALRVLAGSSLDTSRVDRAALRLMIRSARTKHTGIAIQALFPSVSLQTRRSLVASAQPASYDNARRQTARDSQGKSVGCGEP